MIVERGNKKFLTSSEKFTLKLSFESWFWTKGVKTEIIYVIGSTRRLAILKIPTVDRSVNIPELLDRNVVGLCLQVDLVVVWENLL